MLSKIAAEFVGTFWLVLGGAVAPCSPRRFPELGIGFIGVSLAFGLTVLTGAYALGPISGGHFNPAVSVGLWAGGRFPGGQLLPYIVAQVVGGIAAAAVSISSRAARRASILLEASRRMAMASTRRASTASPPRWFARS